MCAKERWEEADEVPSPFRQEIGRYSEKEIPDAARALIEDFPSGRVDCFIGIL